MNYRVLPDAQQDIQDIDDWVSEHFGADFANRTQAQLYDTFDLLTDFPQMGRPRPDIESRPVRFFLLKPYWIVYQPGTPLLIHRIYPAARDPNPTQSWMTLSSLTAHRGAAAVASNGWSICARLSRCCLTSRV